MLLWGVAFAGHGDSDGRKLADSNDVVVLEVDSVDMYATGYNTDTTYFPDEQGISLGWWNRYLFIYGIADLDTTSIDATDEGNYATALAEDSGNICVQLQTSLDGKLWEIVYEDSTMRTRFANGGDSLPRDFMITASDFYDVDSTKCCPLVRASVILIRKFDSAAAAAVWHADDTVWLNDIKILGIDTR